MPDFRKMFDASDFLFAYDLDGRDVVVTIDRIEAGVITGQSGKTNKKPLAFFFGPKGQPLAKRLALNKTNCKTLVQLSGSKNTDDWAGLSITLYATTTSMGAETVDCIRIKNVLARATPTKVPA